MAIDIERALMGLGAAVGGEAPQFRQQMMQEDELARKRGLEDEQAAEKRKQTLFADASAASNLLDQGDVGGVLGLMQDRFQILSQIPNVDTSHTKRYLQLAQAAAAGDMEAKDRLKTEMNNAVTVGKAYNQISGSTDAPSSFRSLQLQAQAAGLKEGDADYQEFMRYGGASGQMGAAKTITYNNGTIVKITRTGAPEVYGPDGQLITDPTQKVAALELARKEGIAYEGDVARSKGLGGSDADRINAAMESGIQAAQTIPDLEDALNLLDTIDTGGFNELGFRMKRILGVTPRDEADLIYLLNKNVLSQLKNIFGAAFTAKEGDLLRDIEAGSGQSTEANRALVSRALDALRERAARGKMYAQDNGNDVVVRDITNSMNKSWESYYDQQNASGDPSVEPVPDPASPPATPRRFKFNPETGELEGNN